MPNRPTILDRPLTNAERQARRHAKHLAAREAVAKIARIVAADHATKDDMADALERIRRITEG